MTQRTHGSCVPTTITRPFLFTNSRRPPAVGRIVAVGRRGNNPERPMDRRTC
ncbi:hypothetical protein [uncultured Porphyromonas sp.]|uniref:hypothetical protein n=1 Tax=uncultured Porphyromonas sp. TaxID=159274 RepID=UPI00260603DB|nr:hypothetical protein [uncultured Porphyromonas sp.]